MKLICNQSVTLLKIHEVSAICEINRYLNIQAIFMISSALTLNYLNIEYFQTFSQSSINLNHGRSRNCRCNFSSKRNCLLRTYINIGPCFILHCHWFDSNCCGGCCRCLCSSLHRHQAHGKERKEIIRKFGEQFFNKIQLSVVNNIKFRYLKAFFN